MTENQLKILIVEDDHNLSDSIKDFISNEFTVTQAFDGIDGEFEATQNIHDLIILDLQLPGQNGLDLLKKVRTKGISTPVLILTAKDSLDDKVRGFNVGADDYLVKPFHREELIVRIKSLLKRSGKLLVSDSLTIGNIQINTNDHTIHDADRSETLNGKEYELIAYLLQNKGTIITKNQIFDRLWGYDSDTNSSVVEVYMSMLRKKLKLFGVSEYIKTIRNVGYLVENTDGK